MSGSHLSDPAPAGPMVQPRTRPSGSDDARDAGPAVSGLGRGRSTVAARRGRSQPFAAPGATRVPGLTYLRSGGRIRGLGWPMAALLRKHAAGRGDGDLTSSVAVGRRLRLWYLTPSPTTGVRALSVIGSSIGPSLALVRLVGPPRAARPRLPDVATYWAGGASR